MTLRQDYRVSAPGDRTIDLRIEPAPNDTGTGAARCFWTPRPLVLTQPTARRPAGPRSTAASARGSGSSNPGHRAHQRPPRRHPLRRRQPRHIGGRHRHARDRAGRRRAGRGKPQAGQARPLTRMGSAHDGRPGTAQAATPNRPGSVPYRQFQIAGIPMSGGGGMAGSPLELDVRLAASGRAGVGELRCERGDHQRRDDGMAASRGRHRADCGTRSAGAAGGPPAPDGAGMLLMRTIGIRDLVLGLGAVAAARSDHGKEMRRWAAAVLASDSLDAVTSLASFRSIGRRESWGAALLATAFAGGDLHALRSLSRAGARVL